MQSDRTPEASVKTLDYPLSCLIVLHYMTWFIGINSRSMIFPMQKAETMWCQSLKLWAEVWMACQKLWIGRQKVWMRGLFCEWYRCDHDSNSTSRETRVFYWFQVPPLAIQVPWRFRVLFENEVLISNSVGTDRYHYGNCRLLWASVNLNCWLTSLLPFFSFLFILTVKYPVKWWKPDRQQRALHRPPQPCEGHIICIPKLASSLTSLTSSHRCFVTNNFEADKIYQILIPLNNMLLLAKGTNPLDRCSTG